jgi:rubrerythrin
MLGVIRRRDILAHPFVTVDCFGLGFFFQALVADRRKTFLSLLAETGVLQSPVVEIPALLGRCVDLESRARRIYQFLAERFSDWEQVRQFFEALARQEQGHSELLELCRQLAGRDGWLEEHFAPWRDVVPQLERKMDELEDSLSGRESLADALRLVIQIESSEIDHVFKGAVAATDSKFVRALEVFRTAGTEHIAFICDRISKFEPDLADECRKLRASHLSETGGQACSPAAHGTQARH